MISGITLNEAMLGSLGSWGKVWKALSRRPYYDRDPPQPDRRRHRNFQCQRLQALSTLHSALILHLQNEVAAGACSVLWSCRENEGNNLHHIPDIATVPYITQIPPSVLVTIIKPTYYLGTKADHLTKAERWTAPVPGISRPPRWDIRFRKLVISLEACTGRLI